MFTVKISRPIHIFISLKKVIIISKPSAFYIPQANGHWVWGGVMYACKTIGFSIRIRQSFHS